MNARVKYPEIYFLLPRGRLVRGSLTEMVTKDHENKPLPPEKHHYWFAVAVPKGSPAAPVAGAQPVDAIVNAIMQHAWNTYQQVAGSQPAQAQMQQGLAATAFSWKMEDGDANPKWSQRDGCKGCWIFLLRSTYPTATFDAANAQLDPSVIKLGDYVDCFISAEINGHVGNTAGIYLNPKGLRYLGEGQRIVVGPDAQSMFGAAVGAGYTAPLPHQTAPSMQVTGQLAAATPQFQAPAMPTHATAGAPGVAGVGYQPAPGGMTAPSHANMSPPVVMPDAAAIAAQFGVPHHPGYRFNPATRGYEPDAAPAQPVQPQQQPGMAGLAPGQMPQQQGGAYIPPAHAGGPAVTGVAVQAPGLAPSAVHGGQPGIASPYSQPTQQWGPGNVPPGLNPHPGFVQ